jgi:HJR/Mrr/RecB family endonuclease
MISFDGLSATEFEEFCADLIRELGFVNVDWRKGTGLSASPSDQGRDIQAELVRTEVDQSPGSEKWFVDCKHYKKGMPPEAVQGLLAWAEAERPDVALVIASGFLSNPAKEYLIKYEQNRRPPFRIKYWERPILERLTESRDNLLQKYLLADPGIRSQRDHCG